MPVSLVGLGLACSLYTSKPTITPTAVLRGKTIEYSQVKKEEYISTPIEDNEWMNVIVTYYSNTIRDCGKTDGIGSNNIRLSRGMGAFPPEFEFGTKLYLDGIGVVENQDRGGAIRRLDDNTIKIDIYIPNASRKYLLKLGTKKVKGRIINK